MGPRTLVIGSPGPRFLDSLNWQQVGWQDGRSLWKTLTPLRYYSNLLRDIVTIPLDFITDGASVPRLPLLWLAVGGRGNRSAVIHDFAYQTGWWPMAEGGKVQVPKKLVDDVFHESLLADPISGCGAVRAWEMWAGVRSNVNGGIWGGSKRHEVLNPIWTREGWPEA